VTSLVVNPCLKQDRSITEGSHSEDSNWQRTWPDKIPHHRHIRADIFVVGYFARERRGAPCESTRSRHQRSTLSAVVHFIIELMEIVYFVNAHERLMA